MTTTQDPNKFCIGAFRKPKIYIRKGILKEWDMAYSYINYQNMEVDVI